MVDPFRYQSTRDHRDAVHRAGDSRASSRISRSDAATIRRARRSRSSSSQRELSGRVASRDGAARHQADRRPARRNRQPRPAYGDRARRQRHRRRAVQARHESDVAAINVQNAVDTARVYLPTDLDPPYVYKNGASEPLLDIAVSSNSLSPTALADIVNNRIEPAAQRRFPTFRASTCYGTTDREFHVEPIPGRILGTDATMLDVFNAVAAEQLEPAGRHSGTSRRAKRASRSTPKSTTPTICSAFRCRSRATPCSGLRVGDVAIAEDGHVEQRSFSHYNGQPRVYIEPGP